MDAITAYLASQPVFSTAGLTCFVVAGLPVGWLEATTVDYLLAHDPRFALQDQALHLAHELAQHERSALLQATAEAMQLAGLIRGWRNERYTCYAADGAGGLDLQHPLFELERAAFRRFGLCSRAVHINGYTADGRLWLGRRAATKSIDPNKRDNLAAGGLPTGETVLGCVIRELWEEAGVPAELACQAVEIEALRTTRNEADGTHDEIIYCFDLLLPDDFTPHNTDGEVAGFSALPASDAAPLLPEFTWDAGLVTARFLLRQAGA
ncbi:protein of unknown function [Andreprevotia lacus DSM 23236]|jgi:8-oxo-dGTP pyrophosphatase MutT (NUDIX family)|uniref:Nudix hydrolase domain-containing protein n=1 Tax=Andreprevotia lacus DSM 23236 TaxID=1121001 RepID=A0A1W1XI08_9NEIS|nr:DUF4743 domain-containing protein [Andreprevotia lacus]SMC23141.1 protein of unknown function [Andreprevotia lacus DSM 23236]